MDREGQLGSVDVALRHEFLVMAFTHRESLRDIEAFLSAPSAQLYHMVFCGRVWRSTVADANEPATDVSTPSLPTD